MNKNEILKTLTDYEMLVVDQRNRLINTRVEIERGADPRKLVNEFVKVNEEIFLKLKVLSAELSEKRPDDMVHVYGKADSFLATMEDVQPGVWKFHLPPLFSTASEEVMYNEGMFTYYLVCRLIEDCKKAITPIKRPVIVFQHHIPKGRKLEFFYDSIEIKRSIEAMQSLMLDGEHAYIMVVHNIKDDAEDPYCEVFLAEKECAEETLKLALC